MSNNISFEDAVANLKAMFPEWDEETLTTILVSNNYHVERTIESVLTMSGDTNVYNNQAPASNPTPAKSEKSNPPSRAISNDSKEGGIPPPPAAAFSPATSDSRYRGRMCTLPDDFLRPPNYHPGIIADEELALMLQNELFRKEAQRLLGEDFNRSPAGSHGPKGGQQRVSATGQPIRRDSRPGEQQQQPADLGIVKALSSMGTAAKKNLSSLAERFKQSSRATTRGGGSSTGGSGRQFKPLVDNKEEDDFELIDFDSHRRQKHRLQSNHDEDEDEEFGQKNPMFHGQRHETNDVSTSPKRE